MHFSIFFLLSPHAAADVPERATVHLWCGFQWCQLDEFGWRRFQSAVFRRAWLAANLVDRLLRSLWTVHLRRSEVRTALLSSALSLSRFTMSPMLKFLSKKCLVRFRIPAVDSNSLVLKPRIHLKRTIPTVAIAAADGYRTARVAQVDDPTRPTAAVHTLPRNVLRQTARFVNPKIHDFVVSASTDHPSFWGCRGRI